MLISRNIVPVTSMSIAVYQVDNAPDDEERRKEKGAWQTVLDTSTDGSMVDMT